MYDDSWYSFVPDLASKSQQQPAARAPTHQRKASLLEQSGIGAVIQPAKSLTQVLESAHDFSPPEPDIIRRAHSSPDLRRDVKHRPALQSTREICKARRSHHSWEALTTDGILRPTDHEDQVVDLEDASLLDASQHKYTLYRDQLTLTERHLDSLIQDANSSLLLLKTLFNSFKSVEDQTSSFQAQCEHLLTEQKRLEALADGVGTNLHYYEYIDNVTRRLNAPGAARLVDHDSFADILDHLESCISFMSKNTSYRDAESYLARYQSLLTKALHLLGVGFVNKLESVSAEIGKQIAATQSDSARHALAYDRFKEMMLDSYSLVPNVQEVVSKVYDEFGHPRANVPAHDIYSDTARNMFHSYITTRDRDLKPMVQRDVEELKAGAKDASLETACRNYIKQGFERAYNEAELFYDIFRIHIARDTDDESVYSVLKSLQRSLVNVANLWPVVTNLQTALQGADLSTVCKILAWLLNEYLQTEMDEEMSSFQRLCRELTAVMLSEHLWRYADTLFEAAVTKTISKATVSPESLKIGPVLNGLASSNAHDIVKKALELLSLFDQCMPKERCKNSPVIFKIVRETIQALQRGEARLRSSKGQTDPDLFMIKNLLILKNGLVSLEIGDIRSHMPSMQHFGHIWDSLKPQTWTGLLSNFIGGSLWPRSAAATATPANALTVEDMSELIDELLRQSIYRFTQGWSSLIHDGESKKIGAKPPARVEKELEDMLHVAFSNQPEVMMKLKEAIQIQVEARKTTGAEEKGERRY